MATLDLHTSERDEMIHWVQNTAIPNATPHCVPLKRLFKFLRMSNITEAQADAKSVLKSESDYKVISARKKLSEYKRTYLTLDATIVFCSWIHSRRKYGKRVYERAYKCFQYAREMLVQMQDTLEMVRQVTIINGLDKGSDKLDTRDITACVLRHKKDKGVAKPNDVYNELKMQEI
jgi:hypothetical protein